MRIRSAEQYEAKKRRLKTRAKNRKGKVRMSDFGADQYEAHRRTAPPMDNEKRFQPIVQCFELPKAGH